MNVVLNRGLCTSLSMRVFTVTLVVIIAASCETLSAADHAESPALMNSAAVGGRDINDIYIFQSPSNSRNTVMIITTNPFAGVLSSTEFDRRTSYQFAIDRNGDAVEDLIYSFRFYRFFDRQLGIVYQRERSTMLGRLGVATPISMSITGLNARTSIGGKFTFGLFDDPFFFDSNGFQNGFRFTGDDFFAGANVMGIVLEVPSRRLKRRDGNIGAWGRTVRWGRQVDRAGRPAINTVLIPVDRRDFFNATRPVKDVARFTRDVIRTLVNGLGRTRQDARALAAFLLPDILTVDVSSSDGFPNGRRLEDDVIDIELDLLSGGAVTTDKVDANDRRFRRTFPYLAAPQSDLPRN